MMVSSDEVNWIRRKVFMVKNKVYFAWKAAFNDEEVKTSLSVEYYRYAKEIEPKLRLTFEKIAKKFNTDVKNIEIIL